MVGAQWGDEGKGKIVDLLAQDSDVVCRYQGGPNAGHTIVVDGETWKLRQMPSGVVSSTRSVIGTGCVVDAQVFVDEVDLLTERGIDPSIVVLSGNAHLIMPWHVTIDQASERRLGSLQIGTTRRGIGPTYADKASRIGIRVQDVLDPKILREKIEVALAEKNLWLERIYEAEPFDLEAVWSQYAGFAERLAPFVGDASLLVDDALRSGKRVLFEGAQATMLDLDHGTYPFVTSSNATAGGACTGAGIPPTAVARVIAIAKAYITRVGEGPFPTELFDENGERLRSVGHEYGTTTGRPRRCGWFDVPVARYASRINGVTDLVITKLDVLTGLDEIPVCVAYDVDGERVTELPMTQTGFHHAVPVYENLPGWDDDISGARSFDDLPKNAQDYITFLDERCGARISAIGVGPERDQTVVLHDLLP